MLIDLLDTLFQLGKAEGSIDAGQMIKPALARGLQLVGATTRESLRLLPEVSSNLFYSGRVSQDNREGCCIGATFPTRIY